jgi:DNA-binding MarR family transcriptional regulator
MTDDVDFAKLTPYKAPEESPGFLLWKTSTLWRRQIEEALKPCGLTHPQFVILAAIAWFKKHDKEITQALIGKHAGLDPNTTSQILRGLQKKNYITRKRALDERSKMPLLTDEGKKKLAQAFPEIEKANAQFFRAAKASLPEFVTILNLLVDSKKKDL